MLFPHRVFISRAERTDRRAVLLERLAANGLAGTQWFPAIPCETLRGDTRGFRTLARRSIALGKRLVLRAAGQQKASALLLFEDDVVFHPEFERRVAALALPDDWALFYFGGLHVVAPEPVSPGIVRARRMVDNHAVAIRSDYYLKVRSAMRGTGKGTRGERHSDLLLSELHRTIPTYAAYPNLIWQGETYSDACRRVYSNYTSDGRQAIFTDPVSGDWTTIDKTVGRG